MELVDGATAGGVVIVALGAFELIKRYMPKSSVNGPPKVMEKQVDEIHSWYGPKGPMDRMTEQMEKLGNTTSEQTGVLKDIRSELTKKD